MTPEEYKQKLNSINSLCDMMKGNTTKEDVEKLRKKWLEELEDEKRDTKTEIDIL